MVVTPLQRHTLQRDPVHQASVAVIVVFGEVSGGAVVPEGDGSGLPFEAIDVFGALGVGEQFLQQCSAVSL